MSKPTIGPKKVILAESEEVEDRQREAQLLFNIVEPDPEYQPIFFSDDAVLVDC